MASSNISKYGYDFVVATTQNSINATMMAFLSAQTEPSVTVCYVADPKGFPIPIEYEELKKKAKGSDPFKVPPKANASKNADIHNLLSARFMTGFRARIGLPDGVPPASLPDIVSFGSSASSVNFNLLCSQFTVVSLNPPSAWVSQPSWFSASQPPGNPWVFSSKVDLLLSTVHPSAYGQLPSDVGGQVQKMGDSAFSVQQLLFDLTNASLMTLPTIKGVVAGTPLAEALNKSFLGAYFTQMQKSGQPILGCSIVPGSASSSTLTLTDFDFEVCPYVDPTGHPFPQPSEEQKQLATLNYLCAADGNSLPSRQTFDWNWVDVSETSDHDGVISINRDTLANYFRNQLTYYVSTNCIQPSVSVHLSGIFSQNINYRWGFTQGQRPQVLTPKTNPPTKGNTVLQFNWSGSSYDLAGLHGDGGELRLVNTYILSVDFVGTNIVISQHQTVYMWIKRFQTSGGGNVLDKKIVDTYSIGIDGSGALVTSLNTAVTDWSNSPSVNKALNFFTGFNQISNDISQGVRDFASTKLKSMPISTIQSYVFPGGKSFIHRTVGFSQYGDLVSLMSYADPTGPVPLAVTQTPMKTVSVAASEADAREVEDPD